MTFLILLYIYNLTSQQPPFYGWYYKNLNRVKFVEVFFVYIKNSIIFVKK